MNASTYEPPGRARDRRRKAQGRVKSRMIPYNPALVAFWEQTWEKRFASRWVPIQAGNATVYVPRSAP